MAGRPEVLAGEDAGQPGGDGGDVVEESDGVMDTPRQSTRQDGTVYPGGDISCLGEVAGRESGGSAEGEDRPIAKQESGEPGIPGARSGVEEDQARACIYNADAAQDAHEADIIEGPKLEPVVVYDAKEEEEESAPQDFLGQRQARHTLLQRGTKRIGGRNAADEDEEGEDEVVGGKAVPVGVFELIGQLLPER